MIKRRAITAAVTFAMAMAGFSFCSTTPSACAQPAPATAPADAKAQVPVRAVALFSRGLGYFEHVGTVEGNASTQLNFKTQQINDILKSLILQASDGGKVTSVDYPSQDPVDRTLHSFQVDITGNPSLANLLEQLRGAKVKLTIGAEELEGTILGVEEKPKAVEKGEIKVPVINLISDGAIRSIELEKVQIIRLENPQLQEELNKALAALVQARDQDKKPVTIHFAGNGVMQVRIGYVVETPVWKTSYRLVLTDNPPATQPATAPATNPAIVLRDGKLQGWAIVENQTDNDWNNVQLSLVSGRPISFIQNLYQPLYVPRPVVMPDLYASLVPQTYAGGMGGEDLKEAANFDSNKLTISGGKLQMGGQTMATNGMQQGQAFSNSVHGRVPGGITANNPTSQPEMSELDITQSVSSLASANPTGELFEYTVGSVSLPRQRSAMIPIITDDVEIEKISIYNQRTLATHPLNGVRLKNTTGKNLLQGPITVLDGAGYAGDARIDDVPPGQQRLISYGVDLNVLVDANKNTSKSTIQTSKIVKGVLTVQRKEEMSQEYDLQNKGDKTRAVILEHPVHPGWALVNTDKPFEQTATLYRFRGSLTKAAKFVVKEERIDSQEIQILQMDLTALQYYQTNGAIPDAVRDALAQAIAKKNAITDTERQQHERETQVAQITAEQGRIRENMRTVGDRTSAYYTRLMTKLNDQETQLESLHEEIEGLRKKVDSQRKDLEEYLGKLNLE